MFKTEKARELKEKRGVTSKFLALKCGLTVVTMRQILSGHAKPGFKTVVRLAQVLEVPYGELIDVSSFLNSQELKSSKKAV